MENVGNDSTCTLHAVSGRTAENRVPENGHTPILHNSERKYQTIVEKKRDNISRFGIFRDLHRRFRFPMCISADKRKHEYGNEKQETEYGQNSNAAAFLKRAVKRERSEKDDQKEKKHHGPDDERIACGDHSLFMRVYQMVQ